MDELITAVWNCLVTTGILFLIAAALLIVLYLHIVEVRSGMTPDELFILRLWDQGKASARRLLDFVARLLGWRSEDR